MHDHPTLRNIKALFVQKKYRQCIHVCETLLDDCDDDLCLYIHFYLAMAHDDLARQMYDRSRSKSARLALAEEYYEEALNLVADVQREYCIMSPQRLPRAASSMSLLTTSSYTLGPNIQLTEHARAMREQILTHLTLVQEVRARIDEVRKKRQASPRTPTLQSSKSFWLFTPETTRSSEKQSRIAEGKAREWKRERFQPDRYILLAEKALAEL
ncbi:hypothetical protein AMS68_001187 [Peltaster fructicola]|uniref:Uncharacterized protein n=1 Tax=Peltaster fructicola TaxID=286661 RepID=A0A6H0XME7_9PEZI|nr:hypothetical protein AMS68_001187 [Peltaster fructicola]